MLGEKSDQSAQLERLALDALGSHRFMMTTIEYCEIDRYYRCADALCHVALQEGFGRSLIEAQALGLPVFAHDSPGARYVLGDLGLYGDFTGAGVLSELLERFLNNGNSQIPSSQALHHSAYSRFSWDVLRQKYVELFIKVIAQNET